MGTERPDARIVSRAEVPTVQTAPKVGLYLAFGALLAFGAGLVSIFIAEALETALSSGDDVERKLGAPFLGSLPSLASGAPTSIGGAADYLARQFEIAVRRGFAESAGGDPAPRPRAQAIGCWGSRRRVTETGRRRLPFISASAAAMQGWKVVVLDCDPNEHGLSDQMPRTRQGGLAEVLNGSQPLDAALVRDPASGAAFLPINAPSTMPDDMFGGTRFAALLGELRKSFELVILDMPSMLATSDARALASQCEEIILLARWRKTPRRNLQTAMRLIQQSGSRVAGVALTRVGAQVGGFWPSWARASRPDSSRAPAFG